MIIRLLLKILKSNTQGTKWFSSNTIMQPSNNVIEVHLTMININKYNTEDFDPINSGNFFVYILKNAITNDYLPILLYSSHNILAM